MYWVILGENVNLINFGQGRSQLELKVLRIVMYFLETY